MATSRYQSTKRKKSKESYVICDIALMAVIHYIFFFLYAAIWSAKHQSVRTSEMAIRNQGTTLMAKDDDNNLLDSVTFTTNHEGMSQHILYEPGYPKVSRTHYFPTRATEKEMAKHDRYLVHGMLYTDMLNDEYLQKHWTLPHDHGSHDRQISINIFMKNRSQPYINAAIMSFMMSHEEGEGEKDHPGKGHELLSFAELNVIDVERRSDYFEYDRQREKVLSLPFLNVHRPYRDDGNKKNNLRTDNSRRLDKIDDYIHAAKHCVQSKLKYCLIMEEYTIVPIDFLQSLQKFIITPWNKRQKQKLNHPIDIDMPILSLFSTYDSETESIIKLDDVGYSRYVYEEHRGKLNSERKSLDLPEYEAKYEVISDNGMMFDSYGYNTAMLFLTSVVEDKLIPFLDNMKSGDLTNTESKIEKNNALHGFDLEKEFTQYLSCDRFTVEPSLINRIGFYDEDYDFENYDDERLGISNWLTDPRFIFELGEYWEGRESYCMKSNGEWIEKEDNSNESECN